MHRLFSILALVVALLPAGRALGQAADPDKPAPKDGTVTAVKGQPITIELASEARTRASVVEFLIRDFPLSGDLGPMVSQGEDRRKISITYTPLQDTAATADSFTYAVRYPGGLWSRQGKVTIKLEASEAKIGATAEADFGRVMIGDSAVREIFLSNSGNATYRNQVRLEPPFGLVDPENGLLDLAVGGQRAVKVRFTPVSEGPVTFNLAFFRNAGSSTVLRGAAYAPFSVAVKEITLRWEEKSRTRLGTLAVTGHAPKLIAAGVRAGDGRLRAGGAGGTLVLKPAEVSELSVYLPPDDTARYEGTLEVSLGDYRVPVKVIAEVAPGYLVVENAGAAGARLIDFGSVPSGGVAQASIQLRNAGGLPCKVNFTSGGPFSILVPGGRAMLHPGESEAFAVRVAAPEGRPGPYEGALKIESDSGQTIPIVLRAAFLPDGSKPITVAPGGAFAVGNMATTPPGAQVPQGTVGAPRRSTPDEEQRAIEAMERMRSPLGFVTTPTVERQVDPNVPPVAGATMALIEDGTRHLSVGWRQPAGSTGHFEIEMLMMRQPGPNLPLEGVWVPYHDVKYLPDGEGQMAAEIRGLGPNRTYEFRLFTLGDAGKVSAPLPFVAKTAMPMDWTWIYVSLGLLLLGGIGYAVWRYWGDRVIPIDLPNLFGRE